MSVGHELRTAGALLSSVLWYAVAGAGFSGSDLFLPMVGRQAGVFPSNWYTEVWIYNPGAEAATARIFFLQRGTSNPTPPFVDIAIAPSDTETIDNVVETLFHLEAFGALRVTCATQRLVVTSRTYSKLDGADDRDSVGQDFAGVPASFAIGLHETTQVLGVRQTVPAADSDSRFNFGFVETTGHSATVRVTVYDGSGANQGFKDLQVREFSQRQVAFKDNFPAVSAENARLSIEVISGSGRVIAYGSGIANGSQDPTTFEMSYADSLLAANVPAGVGGSGAAGQVAFWSGTTTLSGSGSLVWDVAASRLGIGTGAPAQQLELTGNLRLPPTAAGGAAGVLYSGNDRLLHTFGPAADAGNTFVGKGAGNFTMGGAQALYGTGNSALGAGALAADTIGYANTASGSSGLAANTTGHDNTASGFQSLLSNTTGRYNTAAGSQSLLANTTGHDNTAAGTWSLFSNTTGSLNTGCGSGTLYTNSTGSSNTATGLQSLYSNTTGSFNTASGSQSLAANTTGVGNTATGFSTLSSNTTGGLNVASGRLALSSNETGSENVASGRESMSGNTSGSDNTATGAVSLINNTVGSHNVATGDRAGNANVSGSDNTFLGSAADALGAGLTNATAVGNGAKVDASNHVRIGNTDVTQIGGQVAWSNLSDARHKSNVRDLDLGRDFVMALRPVSFTVDGGDGRTDMGFLAQDVEALVGDGYSVLGLGADPERTLSLRYTDLIAPLVKTVQEQQALIEQLLARVASLERAAR
jgi:hypothetical protein